MANTNISNPCCLNVGIQLLSGGVLQPSVEPESEGLLLEDGEDLLLEDGEIILPE